MVNQQMFDELHIHKGELSPTHLLFQLLGRVGGGGGQSVGVSAYAKPRSDGLTRPQALITVQLPMPCETQCMCALASFVAIVMKGKCHTEQFGLVFFVLVACTYSCNVQGKKNVARITYGR